MVRLAMPRGRRCKSGRDGGGSSREFARGARTVSRGTTRNADSCSQHHRGRSWGGLTRCLFARSNDASKQRDSKNTARKAAMSSKLVRSRDLVVSAVADPPQHDYFTSTCARPLCHITTRIRMLTPPGHRQLSWRWRRSSGRTRRFPAYAPYMHTGMHENYTHYRR